jgi:dienelactone hydrolase
VFARFEGLFGEGEVRLVGRGDDDHLDGIVGQNLGQRARNFGCGICFGGLVSFALHDGGEAQAGDCIYERGVKDSPAQPESDDSNANLTLCHYALPISLNAG